MLLVHFSRSLPEINHLDKISSGCDQNIQKAFYSPLYPTTFTVNETCTSDTNLSLISICMFLMRDFIWFSTCFNALIVFYFLAVQINLMSSSASVLFTLSFLLAINLFYAINSTCNQVALTVKKTPYTYFTHLKTSIDLGGL